MTCPIGLIDLLNFRLRHQDWLPTCYRTHHRTVIWLLSDQVSLRARVIFQVVAWSVICLLSVGYLTVRQTIAKSLFIVVILEHIVIQDQCVINHDDMLIIHRQSVDY